MRSTGSFQVLLRARLSTRPRPGCGATARKSAIERLRKKILEDHLPDREALRDSSCEAGILLGELTVGWALLARSAPTRRGTIRNAAAGSSVFASPDPTFGPKEVAAILNDPDYLAEIVAEFSAVSIATRVLGAERQVNEGASWFSELSPEDLKVDGLATRAEGGEYPLVRISPGDLKELRPDDIGGKFRVTDEAVRAGVTDVIGDGIDLITRGIVEALDDMTIAALDAAADSTDHGELGVDSWLGVQLTGADPTPAAKTPAAALITAQARLRQHGMLTRGDVLVINPTDDALLRIAYGPQYADLLTGLGVEPAISNRVPANSAYLVGTNGLGGMVSRQGLVAETWRDPAIRSTWCQVFLEPAVYIGRPANVVRLVGTTTGTEVTP